FSALLRGRSTSWPQPRHRRRKFMPVRSTSHSLLPQGWGFFITRMSCKRTSMSLRSFHNGLPVAPGGLLGLVVAVVVVDPILELVGEVLLLDPVVGVVVGVAVALVALEAGAVGVDVLHFPGEVAGDPGANVLDGSVDGQND